MTNFLSHQTTTCFYCIVFRFHGYQVCFIDHLHFKRYFNQACERCHLNNYDLVDDESHKRSAARNENPTDKVENSDKPYILSYVKMSMIFEILNFNENEWKMVIFLLITGQKKRS